MGHYVVPLFGLNKPTQTFLLFVFVICVCVNYMFPMIASMTIINTSGCIANRIKRKETKIYIKNQETLKRVKSLSKQKQKTHQKQHKFVFCIIR